MSVLVATAYMEEAERFDWLVAMNAGEVLATGSAEELRQQTQSATLEEAFINLLPQAQRQAHQAVVIPPYQPENAEIAIEARDLTMRFVPSLPLITSISAFHAGRFLVFLVRTAAVNPPP